LVQFWTGPGPLDLESLAASALEELRSPRRSPLGQAQEPAGSHDSRHAVAPMCADNYARPSRNTLVSSHRVDPVLPRQSISEPAQDRLRPDTTRRTAPGRQRIATGIRHTPAAPHKHSLVSRVRTARGRYRGSPQKAELWDYEPSEIDYQRHWRCSASEFWIAG